MFAALGVAIVDAAVLAFGATPVATVNAFGDGLWRLIPFTMQIAFVVIGGYSESQPSTLCCGPSRRCRVGRGNAAR